MKHMKQNCIYIASHSIQALSEYQRAGSMVHEPSNSEAIVAKKGQLLAQNQDAQVSSTKILISPYFSLFLSFSLYGFQYIYIYVCIYLYIGIYVHVYIYVYIGIHINMYTGMYAYVYIYIHIYTHMYAYV